MMVFDAALAYVTIFLGIVFAAHFAFEALFQARQFDKGFIAHDENYLADNALTLPKHFHGRGRGGILRIHGADKV